MLLRIDPLSLKKTGAYSRVLVDVDCSLELPEHILVQRNSDEFYAHFFYEFVPHYSINVALWFTKKKIVRGGEFNNT